MAKVAIRVSAVESNKRVDLEVESEFIGFRRVMTAKEARELADRLNQAADDVAPPKKARAK